VRRVYPMRTAMVTMMTIPRRLKMKLQMDERFSTASD
jgi:hypothetical protein